MVRTPPGRSGRFASTAAAFQPGILNEFEVLVARQPGLSPIHKESDPNCRQSAPKQALPGTEITRKFACDGAPIPEDVSDLRHPKKFVLSRWALDATTWIDITKTFTRKPNFGGSNRLFFQYSPERNILKRDCLLPHSNESYKVCRDSAFEEKIRDEVGLDADPPGPFRRALAGRK